MLLDNHIENRVKDEILIFKILFNKKYSHMNDLIEVTQFSKVKILNTIKELERLLDTYISINEIKPNVYSLTSLCDLSCRQIQHIIYQQSNVLLALKFLVTNTNQTLNDFIDSIYISKANAYRVINSCKSFLRYIGLETHNYKIKGDEYRIRYLISTLAFNYGIHCYEITPKDTYKVRQFICETNSFISFDFLEHSQEEYGFFEHLIMLSWIRYNPDYSLPDNEEFEELKTIFIYKMLPSYLDQLFGANNWSKSDYDYIFLVYCSTKNPLFSNQWSEQDKIQVKEIVYRQDRVNYLVNLIEHYFGSDIVKLPDFRTGVFYLYKRYLFNLHHLIKINNYDCNVLKSDLDKEIYNRLVQVKINCEKELNIIEAVSYSELNYFTMLLTNLLRFLTPTLTLTIVSESIADHKLMKHLLYNNLSFNKFMIKEFLLGAEPINTLKNHENNILVFTKSFNFHEELKKENVMILPLNCIDTSFSSLTSLLKEKEADNIFNLINKKEADKSNFD